MKIANNFIDESINDIKRFKIFNFDEELEENRVSKTRRKEIKKYFETILGPAPYYCISNNNERAKDELLVYRDKNNKNILELIEIPDELDEFEKIEYEDENSRRLQKEFIKYYEKVKRHNEMINSISDELKTKLQKLYNEVIGVKMAGGRFKFGHKGTPVELVGAICEYNGTVIPCIFQIGSQSDGYIKSGETTYTYYLSCKDIDDND